MYVFPLHVEVIEMLILMQVSYFAATTTNAAPAQTSTIISVVVTTLTIYNRLVAKATKQIPVYASECKDAAQYLSACSCGFGVTTSGGTYTVTRSVSQFCCYIYWAPLL